MKRVQIVIPFVHAAVAMSGRYVLYFLICFLLFFILLPRFRFDIRIMCEFIVCFRRTYVTAVISRITIKCTCMFKNKNRQKAILTGLPRGDFSEGRGRRYALIVPFWMTFVTRKMSTIF